MLQQNTLVPEIYEVFQNYLNERESIRLKRERGEPGPWTQDPVLSKYKFTNVLRSNDRTTKWVKKNWYDANRDASPEILAMNCALFRYFGSIEFAEAIGFQRDWRPDFIIDTATERLARGQKVFTGAYIITNAGRSDPKQNVVVSHFLTPYRFNIEKIVNTTRNGSWRETSEFLQTLPGIGAFMSKEIVLDMMLTPLLENAKDKLTWTPVGPGAARGLNRLHGRPTEKPVSQKQGLEEMQSLLADLAADQVYERLIPEFPRVGVEYGVTDVQFSLCELDKYLRVKNGEGRPRSGYDWKKAKALT